MSLAVAFVTIPWTLNYLGQERFGIWMALNGLVASLSFADLGMGVGIQNSLSQCSGRRDKESPSKIITSGFALLLLLCLTLVLCAAFVLPFMPISQIFKVQSPTGVAELLPTAQSLLVVFALTLPAIVIQRIYNAYQMGYIANLYLAGGSVASLLILLGAINFRATLPTIVAIVTGVPLLGMATSAVHLPQRVPFLRLSKEHFSVVWIRQISSIGSTALGAQFGATLLANGPAIIIANTYGTQAVTPYALTQKLLSVGGLVLMVTLTPLWPVYSQAAAAGDLAWVRRTFRRSLILAAVVSSGTFIIVLLIGRAVILAWTRNIDCVPSTSMVVGCCVWSILFAWSSICGVLLNGLNNMLGQAIYGILIPVLALSVAYKLAPYYGKECIIWCAALLGEGLRGVCLGLEVWLALRQKHAASEP